MIALESMWRVCSPSNLTMQEAGVLNDNRVPSDDQAPHGEQHFAALSAGYLDGSHETYRPSQTAPLSRVPVELRPHGPRWS